MSNLSVLPRNVATLEAETQGSIEMLHNAWQEAFDVASTNDELDGPSDTLRETWARRAVQTATQAQMHIENAILVTPIRTEADATILMLHLDMAIETMNNSVVKEGDPIFQQILCASNSLLDWRLRTAPSPASFQSRNTVNYVDFTKARQAHLRGECPQS